MPRRIPDFPDSFHSWNFLSSIGSGITLLSFAMFSHFLVFTSPNSYHFQVFSESFISLSIHGSSIRNLIVIPLISFSHSVTGEDSMLRRVHPKKRSVSWVNSVPRQFLPNGSFPNYSIAGLPLG